jgi:glucosamine kinase
VTILAVDAGRTTFRAAVFSGGRRHASVHLDSGATLADPDGLTRLVDLLAAARRALGAGAGAALDSLVVAAAGAHFRPAQAEALARAIAEPGDAAEVVVTTDVVAAHAGALRGRPGVVLAAGTGAVAFAVDATGTGTLVDGAGYLVGDAGSGFAVGRAGLAAALRHHDGRPGGSAPLATLAAEQFGPLAELPGLLHVEAHPARAVAGFAPAVAAAARQADPVAVRIWQVAVDELADTATAACEALPVRDRRVATTGSLFDLSDLVSEPFAATMASRLPGVPVRRAAGDALAGAARLAGRTAAGYENLLLRRASTPDTHHV